MDVGINSNKYSKKTIDEVSMGPNGEWFVRWTDNSWKANGIADDLDDKLKELKRSRSCIR